MKKLDIFTRYDQTGASSRLRYYLYQDSLQQANWQLKFHPFFDGAYLKKLYSGGGKTLSALVRGWAQRYREIRQADCNLLLEYELLPFLPAGIEKHFLKKHRYVLNFDDWVWEKYARLPILRNKYDKLIKNAAGVIVANAKLQEKILPLNPHTIQIPTVIDLAAYPTDLPKYPRFTVVWIGTPVTYQYLQHFAERFKFLASKVDFELLTIATDNLPPLSGVPQRQVAWSAASEGELLAQSHVGIMPLTDDVFSRGKSAYKLIQFMASGLPAIASPVGENCRIILPGQTGFLAQNDAEWLQALQKLATDSKLRATMGHQARLRAAEFSLQKYAPILNNFLTECFNS